MMAASLILLIMVVVVFAVTYFGGEAEKIQISDPEGLLSLKVSESGEQIPPDSPMMLPGLIKPSTITAEEAPVDDGEQILGVSVDDAHRAYLLSSFNLIGQKIVNDIERDFYLSAAAAKEYGLIDQIFDRKAGEKSDSE